MYTVDKLAKAIQDHFKLLEELENEARSQAKTSTDPEYYEGLAQAYYTARELFNY